MLLLRIEWLLRRTCKYFRWERVGNGGEARASQAGLWARVLARGVLDGAPRRRSKPVDLCSRAFSVLFSESLSSAEVAEVAEVWKLGADVADSRPPSPDGKRGSIRP